MLKNKLSAPLFVGGMAVIGLVAGIATMASAQTSAPIVAPTTTTAAVTQVADTPEPGDVVDSATVDTPEAGDVADMPTTVSAGQTGESVDKANDTDGSASSEASEPAGSSDASGR
jgi:hypothetical protein